MKCGAFGHSIAIKTLHLILKNATLHIWKIKKIIDLVFQPWCPACRAGVNYVYFVLTNFLRQPGVCTISINTYHDLRV